MKFDTKKIIIFFLIVFIAGILRFWQLGQVPASPDWDEVALGYNAYSILKTGRDEYGIKLPLTLRSYDDYKPPLYAYLTIPSVAGFGLTVWSVRLPSAIMGMLAVVGVYFLAAELIALDLRRKSTPWDSWFPMCSMALLAISPWHIQFSRIAFEANTGVTFNIWAIYAFLRGRKYPWLLGLSTFLFGMSLYAYHSERVFSPLIFILLTILFWKDVTKNIKAVIVALAIGALTILPLVFVILSPNSMMRLQGTTSLADETGLLMRTTEFLQDDLAAGNKLGVVFDNRRIVWVKTILDGYLSHFSFQWLFINGDNPRHHAPDMGLLYLWELPFLLWGMVTVWKKGVKTAIFLFGWLFFSPVAASVTTELPHAIRTLVFLPDFQLFTAFGIGSFLSWTREGSFFRKIWIPIMIIAVLFNLTYYLDMYYIHMDHEFSEYWQYGYQQAVEYAQAHKGKYTKIVVSTKLEQPHMFFLFYTKYDPEKYLAGGGTASGGFAEVKNHFDIYDFRPIHWSSEIKDGKTLYIGTAGEIPVGSLDTIHYLDGTDAIHIADH